MLIAAARALAAVVTRRRAQRGYIVPSVFHPDVATAVAAAVSTAVRATGTRSALDLDEPQRRDRAGPDRLVERWRAGRSRSPWSSTWSSCYWPRPAGAGRRPGPGQGRAPGDLRLGRLDRPAGRAAGRWWLSAARGARRRERGGPALAARRPQRRPGRRRWPTSSACSPGRCVARASWRECTPLRPRRTGRRRLTGRLLVATPALGDSNFERAVVLVLDHDEDGALGVVINRPTPRRRRRGAAGLAAVRHRAGSALPGRPGRAGLGARPGPACRATARTSRSAGGGSWAGSAWSTWTCRPRCSPPR